MDYKKKYKELLAKAEKMHREDCDTCQSCLEQLFPELTKSKDERIRKELVKYFTEGKEYLSLCSFSKETILDWLERQKLVEWSDKDVDDLYNYLYGDKKSVEGTFVNAEPFEIEHGKYYYCIKDYYSGGCKRASKGDVVQALRGLSIMALNERACEYFLPVKSIEHNHVKWSEEDEEMLNKIIAHFNWHIETRFTKEECYKAQDWLKSLRPLSHWIKVENDTYVKDVVLAQRKDKSDGFNGYIICADHTLKKDEYDKNGTYQFHWKPTEKQIKALKWILQNVPYNTHKQEIADLTEQLKTLL